VGGHAPPVFSGVRMGRFNGAYGGLSWHEFMGRERISGMGSMGHGGARVEAEKRSVRGPRHTERHPRLTRPSAEMAETAS